VIVDEVNQDGAIGRSKADAPEIDGLVYLNRGAELTPGERVTANVVRSDDHDLWAELTDQ